MCDWVRKRIVEDALSLRRTRLPNASFPSCSRSRSRQRLERSRIGTLAEGSSYQFEQKPVSRACVPTPLREHHSRLPCGSPQPSGPQTPLSSMSLTPTCPRLVNRCFRGVIRVVSHGLTAANSPGSLSPQGTHRHFNHQILNPAFTASQQSPHPIAYTHLHELDTFVALPGAGNRKVRIRRNKKTGQIVDIVEKRRLADLNVYCPMRRFDYRLSISEEIPSEHCSVDGGALSSNLTDPLPLTSIRCSITQWPCRTARRRVCVGRTA